MREKVKSYLDKAKEVLKKVSKKVYIAVAVLLAAAVMLVVWLNTRPYAVLFTDLNSSEMSSILSYLEESGVTEYQVQDNDTILVPENLESALRAKLLMAEYPQSGFSYTYSTSTGALSTESERNRATLYDLQDRMGATIRCFDNVRDAVVTINTGEDASYVLDSNKMVSASASVFVTMREGSKLTNEQVEAIRRLVAHSVKGLEIGSVTVEDASGNTYNSTEAHMDSDASALKLQLEEDYENKIRTQVLQALVPFFGEGNVRVGVSCTVDINQTVLESTEYHLPEWADDGSTYGRGIVGSRVFNYIYERNGEETTGGVVGTSTNADLPEYVEDLPELNGNENLVDISGQTDYQTSSTNKQIIQTAGYLTDCSISVSINSKTADNLSTAEIIQHVARASGISGSYDEESGREYLEDKISVICAPFYDGSEGILPAGPTLPVDMWVIYAAAAGLLLFLLVLLLILRRRKKKKKTKQAEQQNRDIEAFLAAAANARADQIQDGADVMSLQSEKSIELRKDIRKFAEDNPEIAAQMLRGWLRGDDDNG